MIYCHSSPVCISEGDVKTDYLGAIALEKDCNFLCGRLRVSGREEILKLLRERRDEMQVRFSVRRIGLFGSFFLFLSSASAHYGDPSQTGADKA